MPLAGVSLTLPAQLICLPAFHPRLPLTHTSQSVGLDRLLRDKNARITLLVPVNSGAAAREGPSRATQLSLAL